jgi:molybdenum cofactor biosynthesis enzyme MoaA
MCYQKDTSFNKKSGGFMGHMKLDLFKKIIDQVDGKLEAVTLASRGEPLLNPAFDQMLKYADQKFLALKLNTNASLLNEKNINSILSTNIQTLVFSIDASEKELYEKIRVNGNFDKIIKNLELFSKIRKENFSKSKIITRVSGVAINDQVNIKSMTETWKKYVDTVSLVNYSPLDDTYNNEINNIEEPCLELWRRLFIWWDGKINVCDVDYKSTLSKWNIEENSIKDIWNSEYYNFLRTKHLEAKRSTLEPCIRCIST